jgi:predicted dehydrogenase
MARKKILIIGYGSIGQKHHSILKKNFKKFNLFFISKKKNILNKINFNDIENHNFHSVLICSPASLHLNHLKKILKIKTKTNIFVEKPISDSKISLKENNILKKQIKKKKIFFKVGYCMRYHPVTIYLKNYLNSISKNDIIDVSFITNSYLPHWRTGDYTKKVSAKKKLGGGVLNELSHEIDLLLYLFAKPKKVFAKIGNSKLLKIDTEDNAKIIYLMNKLEIYMHLDFSSFIERRLIEIRTKKNFLQADFINNEIRIIRNKKIITKKFYSKTKNLYISQFKNFFKKNDLKFSINNLTDAISVNKIIHKIRLSSNQNKLIRI